MEASTDKARELYACGRERMNAKDFAGAIALFEESVDIAPHFKVLELLGECFLLLEQLQRAIVSLAAATSLNDQPRAPSLLADALYRLGENELAIRMARLALARGSGNKIAERVLEKLGANVEDDL